ncbi:pilus assembly protein PilP [Kushneria phosphatilytica]|uniref:Pilus assembly protein PilP n=1 Tax=Kushneria phosphatilytica TaxID=657387 RepID=A0A1S1NUW2_9GAMM|nr:pilus assembly protein PilP [Kushneria phosphatilytica]OHV10510.1 hypothetical protein BH688_08850 [Kushneria phosphatilytica]QEL11929.1 pilus assembly protein PilP [Kushneria phosphatilytica]
MKTGTGWIWAGIVMLGVLLAGCQRPDIDALDARLQALRERPTGHVEALPEQPVYRPVTYDSGSRRDPFTPWAQLARSSGSDDTPYPDPQRPRDPLERFALESLRLAGTLTINSRTLALIQTPEGEVVRLRVGEHLGEHDGRVTAIEEGRLTLVELLPDGRGGFATQQHQLTLTQAASGRQP